MAGKHIAWGRNKRRAVGLRRSYREAAYDGYGNKYAWTIKGHRDEALDMLADRDAQYNRARRGVGWKNCHCRRQWERNVIERAALENNRRKESVRGW